MDTRYLLLLIAGKKSKYNFPEKTTVKLIIDLQLKGIVVKNSG